MFVVVCVCYSWKGKVRECIRRGFTVAIRHLANFKTSQAHSSRMSVIDHILATRPLPQFPKITVHTSSISDKSVRTTAVMVFNNFHPITAPVGCEFTYSL